jgi:hypothetical protein
MPDACDIVCSHRDPKWAVAVMENCALLRWTHKSAHIALSHTHDTIYICVCVSILCMFQTNAFVSLYWLTYIDIIYVNVHLFLYICIYLSSCLFIFHIVYNVDIEFIILFSYCYVSLLVTYFSIYIPMHLPIYLATYLHVQLWTYLPIYLSIYLRVCLSPQPIYLSTYAPIFLSACLPICLSTYLATQLSSYLASYFGHSHNRTYINITTYIHN